MGKSAPSPPPAPDYVGAAQAQGVANKDAAVSTASLSNPNMYTPYGNQTVSYANTGPDGNPQPTVTQSLTPDAQRTLNAQQAVQYGLAQLGQQGLGQASDVLGSQFKYNGPGIQTGLDTSGIAKMPVNAGVTGQQAILSRLQPQIDQRNAATAQQLANQGLTHGGEAYTNAMRDQNNANNDLYSQAALQGLGLDMQANQQGYNQALQSGQFANTASAQNLQQQLGLYNQPLNQITALMSGSQIQNPQFQQYSGANVGAAPIANATSQLGQYNQGIYGQQVAQYNAGMQGLGSALGGAAGMFSFAPIAL